MKSEHHVMECSFLCSLYQQLHNRVYIGYICRILQLIVQTLNFGYVKNRPAMLTSYFVDKCEKVSFR